MTATTPTWRSRVPFAALRTTGLIVFACCSTLLASGYAHDRARTADGRAFAVVGGLIGVAFIVALVWRHRWPLQLTLAASLASIVLPLDAFVPLVGVYATVLVADELACATAGVAATVAVAVSIWRDSAGHGTTPGENDATSVWRQSANPTGAHYAWWLVLTIALALVAAATALGILSRNRIALRHSRTAESEAHETAARATLQASQLGEQLTRQQEREHIAQEVHDVLGHRLSLLSLHAGALEVAAKDDPTLVDRARLVREGAQQSMGDLRSLLAVLRNPGEADQREPMRTLQDLPALIDECIAAGSPVTSSIFVDESEPLDPVVSHSVYRITQELLTNARKHVPGAPIRLQVTGRPSTGIQIDTTNPSSGLIPGAPIHSGGGLTGLNERTTRCGGRSWVWVEDDRSFRCRAIIPWSLPGTTGHRPAAEPLPRPYPSGPRRSGAR